MSDIPQACDLFSPEVRCSGLMTAWRMRSSLPSGSRNEGGARSQVLRRLLANHVSPEARILIETQGGRMIPIVRVKPDAAGLQCPFMVKSRVQEPRAEPLALGGRDHSKVLQLYIGQVVFKFAQPERLIVSIPQDVNPAALRLEKKSQFRARHVQALIPAKRPSHTSIKLQVLAHSWLLTRNALLSRPHLNWRRGPGELEVAYKDCGRVHDVRA
jgi:hypothetical protein